MGKFALIGSVMLAVIGLALPAFSQDNLAPLYLFTTGSGTITPLQSDQLLDVGASYTMTAEPDPGYEFSSWQEVNVYISATTVSNQPPIISEIVEPLPGYVDTATLTFIMRPQTILISGPTSLTEDPGWQASFISVPEPPVPMLVACGMGALVLAGKQATSRK